MLSTLELVWWMYDNTVIAKIILFRNIVVKFY